MKDFTDQFNQQKLRTYNLDEMVAITAFCSGVQHAKCATSFHRNWLVTLIELFERVGKYIDTEEFLKSKGSGFVDNESAKAKRKHEGLDKAEERSLSGVSRRSLRIRSRSPSHRLLGLSKKSWWSQKLRIY